ncbi:MAG: hypothetical protein ACYCY5_09435, partial [Sulfuricella sp.]
QGTWPRNAKKCAGADDPLVERIPASPYALNHPRKNPVVSNTLKSVTPMNIIYSLLISKLNHEIPEISGQ